jgi:hypothetical protein
MLRRSGTTPGVAACADADEFEVLCQGTTLVVPQDPVRFDGALAPEKIEV